MISNSASDIDSNVDLLEGVALHELFEAYERRFSQATASIPPRQPWIESDRGEILRVIERCLGITDAWIPEIRATVALVSDRRGFSVDHLQSTSWPGCHGAAYLYFPEVPASDPSPVVILACGHGAGGKQAESYRLMAEHLARNGIAVLVPDNIGQGERAPMGHSNPVQIFGCGLSVQGLIVMETIGWLNWLRAQSRFDSSRIAAIGNSGGGTLTMLLGALRRDELAVVSSSGYPSTFEFIARKEKKHCHCNLLPHIVGELEMWQVYGCIAPKPLFLFQGRGDPLFPGDLLLHTARKVSTAYERRNAAPHFRACLVDGAHSWDAARRRMLAEYLCETLGVPFDEARIVEPANEPALAPCFQAWPGNARNVDEIARDLSGRTSGAAHLWEVFKPPVSMIAEDHPVLRSDARQILAQFEAFLPPPVKGRSPSSC